MSGRHLALHLIHLLRQKQTGQTRDPVRQAANDDRGTRTLVSHAPSEMTTPTRNGAEDKESTSSRQNKPLSREPGAGPPRLATNKRSAAVPLGALHQERIEPAHVHIAVPHIVRAFSIELQSGRSSCEGIAVVRTQSRRDGPNCCCEAEDGSTTGLGHCSTLRWTVDAAMGSHVARRQSMAGQLLSPTAQRIETGHSRAPDQSHEPAPAPIWSHAPGPGSRFPHPRNSRFTALWLSSSLRYGL